MILCSVYSEIETFIIELFKFPNTLSCSSYISLFYYCWISSFFYLSFMFLYFGNSAPRVSVMYCSKIFILSLISAFSIYIFSMIFCSSWTVSSLFILGLFFTLWAFYPNLNVDMVSARCISWGEHVTIKVVFEFPPRESLRILVNFVSL